MFKHPSHRVTERSKYEAPKRLKPFSRLSSTTSGAVTGCAQHGVNPVAGFTLQRASTRSLVTLQMSDHGLNGLAALHRSQCSVIQPPLLATVIVRTSGEYRERVSEIDHLIQSGAKKISRIYPKRLRKISEELLQVTPVSSRFRHHSIARKSSIHAGLQNIAGPTTVVGPAIFISPHPVA